MTNEQTTIELVDPLSEQSIAAFLKLGREYLREIDPANKEKHEAFLSSMLKRQGEPDRWLHLLKHGTEYIGLAHSKIDHDDRPGWGYILEFYVVSSHRRFGHGKCLCMHIFNLLRERGVVDVWLGTHPLAERFWQSLGFECNGEMEGEYRVMVTSIRMAE